MSKLPLDERIVTVLTQPCRSDAAAGVLAEAEAAYADMERQADASDVLSLSPLATARDAHELRSKAADQRFDADRMDASISALRTRLDELKHAERIVAREAAERAAAEERDELAAEIAEQYPSIVARLASLMARIEASDAHCARVGLRGGSAEAIGRGVPANFYINGGPIMRIREIKLPAPKLPRLTWEWSLTGDLNFHGLASDAQVSVK